MDELHKQHRIPVTLVGGYLGSGKTTLVNQLLSDNNGQRIAVLVNDFGTLEIDAQLIEAEDGDIISLSGGCVCCSYGNDLSSALMDVTAMESLPDQIVIEASGVALPRAIAASVSLMPNLFIHGTLILINAELIREQANDRYVADTIRRQLSSGDLLVLNKIDLVANDEVIGIQQWLEEEWPHARVVCVQQSRIPSSVVMSSPPLTTQALDGGITKTHSSSLTENSSFTHASLFHAFTLEFSERIDSQAVLNLLTSKPAQLARAKGFVMDASGTVKLLQIVGRRGDISDAPINANVMNAGGVVCIGLTGDVGETFLRAQLTSFQSRSSVRSI